MARWTNLRRRHIFQTTAYAALVTITLFFTAIFHALRGRTVRHTSKGLESRSTSRLLVTTSCSFGQKEILANFACNIRRICPSRAPVVYSLDRETHAFASSLGLSSVLVIKGKGQLRVTNSDRNGSVAFDTNDEEKLSALMTTLKSGLDVLYSDVNTIWCRDTGTFLEYLMNHGPYMHADVLIQADEAYRALNWGFFLIRSNPRTLKLFGRLSKRILDASSNRDVMSKVFCDEDYGGRKIYERHGDVPFWCESHGVVLRVLPTQLFPTGAERYDSRNVFAHSREELLAMCRKGEFIILRNNHIPASNQKARLIRKGFWHVKFDGLDEPKCGNKPIRDSIAAAQTCGLFC